MSLQISDDKLLDTLSSINAQLTSLNANMTMVLDKLSSHEARITKLEENKAGLKDIAIAWLIKGIVASIFVIGSISGAGALLKGLFNL